MGFNEVTQQWQKVAHQKGVHFIFLPKDPRQAHRALVEHAQEHGLSFEAGPGDWGGSLIEQIQNHGGFTVADKIGDAPTKGFMVSQDKTTEEKHPYQDVIKNPEILDDYYRKHQAAIQQPSNYFGAWHAKDDDGNDQVYLDVPTHTNHEMDANDKGHAAQQLAYFDLNEGKSYKVRAPWERSVMPGLPRQEGARKRISYGQKPSMRWLGGFKNPTIARDQILAALKDGRHR